MPAKVLPVLYLHGFASSPNSRKARLFAEKLAELGVRMNALDLEQGDFENLTLTRQLGVVERAAKGEPVVLIGSSMGGYLAALYAARHPEVARLILLAPAFSFLRPWKKELGQTRLSEWRKRGTIPVFHYGEGTQMDLGYSLLEDAEKYEDYPAVSQPSLIFHGRRDTVVPFEMSEVFARRHANAHLVELQSGHELTDVLNEIWNESNPFLIGQTYEEVAIQERSSK